MPTAYYVPGPTLSTNQTRVDTRTAPLPAETNQRDASFPIAESARKIKDTKRETEES